MPMSDGRKKAHWRKVLQEYACIRQLAGRPPEEHAHDLQALYEAITRGFLDLRNVQPIPRAMRRQLLGVGGTGLEASLPCLMADLRQQDWEFVLWRQGGYAVNCPYLHWLPTALWLSLVLRGHVRATAVPPSRPLCKAEALLLKHQERNAV